MTGLPEKERKKETKLIMIVACGNSLVGLTNKGHVLKAYRVERGTWAWDYVSEGARMIWHPLLNRDMQLSNFSEMDEVREHPAFYTTTGNDGKKSSARVELLSDTMLITHVSHIALISSKFRA